MNIPEKNRLIAEFMKQDFYPPNEFKYQVEHGAKFFTPENMQYHNNWSWIIPVVIKINELNLSNPLPNLSLNDKLVNEGEQLREAIHYYLTTSDILRENKHEEVFTWSVNFIEWYNKNLKQ